MRDFRPGLAPGLDRFRRPSSSPGAPRRQSRVYVARSWAQSRSIPGRCGSPARCSPDRHLGAFSSSAMTRPRRLYRGPAMKPSSGASPSCRPAQLQPVAGAAQPPAPSARQHQGLQFLVAAEQGGIMTAAAWRRGGGAALSFPLGSAPSTILSSAGGATSFSRAAGQSTATREFVAGFRIAARLSRRFILCCSERVRIGAASAICLGFRVPFLVWNMLWAPRSTCITRITRSLVRTVRNGARSPAIRMSRPCAVPRWYGACRTTSWITRRITSPKIPLYRFAPRNGGSTAAR